jgi:histidine phosphotransferase ChpT
MDLKASQFLCSRICHDLIGPVGAVNAGMELLSDLSVPDDEALGLVADSAAQVVRRLEYYRVAFGMGGGSGPRPLDEARKLALNFVSGGKVALDWPDDNTGTPQGSVGSGGVKLVMNLVLLAHDCLPRGGTVAVRLADLADGVGVAVTASGTGARLKDGVGPVMASDDPGEALSAHTAAAYFAQQLAQLLGGSIETFEDQGGEVRFAALLPGKDEND